MRVLANKIFVRITKENRENIYSKEITRDDGSKVRLFLNVPAIDEMDERRSALYVQTGVVEEVGEKVSFIKKGDIALLDFQLCNMNQNLVYKDDDGEVFWLNANTTYHQTDLIAYASRRSPKDQIAFEKGDYNELSMLLGIISDDKLIANDPYVFLEHEEAVIKRVTSTGIMYDETQRVFDRRILSISKESSERIGVHAGDLVKVKDADIFNVKFDNKVVHCMNDMDCLGLVTKESKLRAV